MRVMRFPGRPNLQAEFQRMERDLERLWSSIGSHGQRWQPARRLYPPLNLSVDSEHFIVECELPGWSLDQLELSVTGDTLQLKGTRDEEPVAGASYHRRERRWGTFSRSITLPDMVDSEKTSARLKDGILRIELPKTPEAKPRQITVKAG